MVLKNFENLAHVGGVVTPSDDEKLKNLFKYLSEQIIFRKERLLSVGVSSYMSYKEAGYIDIPQIVVCKIMMFCLIFVGKEIQLE